MKLRQVQDTAQGVLRGLEPRIHWLPASVGHPSRRQVRVPGRNDYIYAQLRDVTKRIVQAYCPWGTPSYGQLVRIRLVRSKGGSYYEVGQPARSLAPTLTGKQAVYGQVRWNAPYWVPEIFEPPGPTELYGVCKDYIAPCHSVGVLPGLHAWGINMQICPPLAFASDYEEYMPSLCVNIRYSDDCGGTWKNFFSVPWINALFDWSEYFGPPPATGVMLLPCIPWEDVCMKSPIEIDRVFGTNVGNILTGAGSLTDTGQDFTPWAVPGAPAHYVAVAIDPTLPTGAAYGYIGYVNAPWTTSIYGDENLSIPGWVPAQPVGLTSYEIHLNPNIMQTSLDPIALDTLLRLDSMGQMSHLETPLCCEIDSECVLTVSLRVTEG